MDLKLKHFIGIDLGTTNCSVAMSRGELIQDSQIYQAVGDDLFEHLNQLPSYLYLPPESETKNFQHYPFNKQLPGICGTFAKQRVVSQPSRVVRSAKSWISLANENSTNRILPFDSQTNTVNRLSAVEVQAAYLRQIALSLNIDALDDKSIVITIPASFSEFSRQLTLRSAKDSGLPAPMLLEEPLAAFYNWMFYTGKQAKDLSSVLVIDVGGGTTDFSLLKQERGQWQRVAVGRHLLLGGDNLDLALAVLKEKELGRKLPPQEFNQLVHHCREVKEDFLGGTEEFRECTILSSSSSLFESAFQVKFERTEVESFLLDGFFPVIESNYKSSIRPPDLGLREFGLPFEKNPKITEHLIDFITNNQASSDIDAILFHGGTLLSKVIKDRLQKSLENHLKRDLIRLNNPEPSLGVSHGACVYALARDGQGQLIQAGLSNDLYLRVEQQKSESYYCIAVRGQSENEVYEAEHIFQLKGHQRVSFPLIQGEASHQGILGEILDELPDSNALPTLETKLDSSDPYIPVQLTSQLLSNGAVEINLRSVRSSENFTLKFASLENQQIQVRKAPIEAEQFLKEIFGRNTGKDKKQMRGLIKKLESMIGHPRKEWGIDTCRFLARVLVDRCRVRRRSEEAEAAFYNTVGYLLRPGFGHQDDHKLIGDLDYAEFCNFPKKIQNRVEYWIYLRRIAGGTGESFQNTLMQSYGNYLFGKASVLKLPGGAPKPQEIKEMWRTFANFEWLNNKFKVQLFEKLFNDFKRSRLEPSEWWLLGRIGSRQMQYAPFDRCLSPSIVEPLLDECISRISNLGPELISLVRILSLPASHRDLDYSNSLREKIKVTFPQIESPLESDVQQKIVFGESVPLGLKILK